MSRKTMSVAVLVLLGIYFVLFHTAPYPFNHEAIGLPPFHVAHTVFGVSLLFVAFRVWQKK